MKVVLSLAAILLLATAQNAVSQAPAAAGGPPKIRPVPPPGIEVPATDRTEIEAGLKQLADAIAPLKKNPQLNYELPNVEIFHKSADWALRYNEIFEPKQIAIAKEHIKQGLERAAALAKGDAPWNKQTGLLVRAYRSRIDGSVQPYGLVIPANWTANESKPRRLDFWCHGRGEKLSELAFIADRQKNAGEFVPEGAIVCHLYGRFCNANKFAGEVDLFEALEDIKRHYAIDERRLVIRGFSMGGAACWQFATHYSGMWAAAAPGAGFAETAEFFKVFAPGKEAPPAWEQKLWRWYDCTTMAANLANTSVVAYSGEIDGQKQAADIMVKYAGDEGITFPHIIGPQTPHKYHKDSIPEIEKLVTAAAEKGRDEFPNKVRLVTYSQIYSHAPWFSISGMEKQWERAEVQAAKDGDTVTFTTKNVNEISMVATLQTPAIHAGIRSLKKAVVDGQNVELVVNDIRQKIRLDIERRIGDSPQSTVSCFLRKENGKWTSTTARDGVRKQPSLCGPIDHAFMEPFVFIRPTGKPLNDVVGAWSKAEMDHAIAQWRQVFRGDVKVIDDTAWLEMPAGETRLKSNIVLWGDPSSNAVLKQMLTPEDAAKKPSYSLPLKWDGKTLELGTQKVDPASHAPIFIAPNPLNPQRYVVLNSGPTFREAASLNNSDQTPKLPDWAVVDVSTPPGPKWPGKVVDAGFFDENWK